MMKKVFALGTLCLGMAALLCGCGGQSKEESTESTETASETVTETETVPETAAEDSNLYAFSYDVEDLVKLGEYKGLTYTITDTSVSDAEVDEQVASILTSKATKEQITDRQVEDGDTVNIDYEGLLDGVAFDGGTAQGASLTIGSDSYIDGFEDGLIGAEPGKEVALNLTFPETYKNNPDLAGKAVVFNVTVNYIEGEDNIPELTDDFVKDLAIEDVETVDGYREYIRSQLQENKEADAENNKKSELIQKAVGNAEIKKLPEELVAQYVDEYKSYYQQYASYFGMEMSDFLTQYVNMTEEEFESEAQKYGEQVAGSMLVVSAIAKAEGIDVDAQYDEKAAEFAKQAGYADAATLEADYGRNYIKQVIISEAAVDIIVKEAKGVEAAETEEAAETTAK